MRVFSFSASMWMSLAPSLIASATSMLTRRTIRLSSAVVSSVTSSSTTSHCSPSLIASSAAVCFKRSWRDCSPFLVLCMAPRTTLAWRRADAP